MSKESTQPGPLGSQDQASRTALSPESDPSGFTERAPTLLSLLPDKALSDALARGDALALHRALRARLSRESPGPLRDTLRQLLDNRGLFTVSELPPRLASFLGTGVRLVGLPSEQQQAPFVATRAICLLGVPVWPLGEHLVEHGRDGQLQVLGHVVAGSASLSTRKVGLLALAALGLAGAGAALAPFAVREVQIVNGLSRPVEVRLDGQSIRVEPGQLVQEQVYGLGKPYAVEARWPGAEKPFEVLSVESNQRTLYNILEAASLMREDPAEPNGPYWLFDRTSSLEPEARVLVKGGWETRVRGHEESGQWESAAELAKAVFLADPSQLQAGHVAARLLVHNQPDKALGLARELHQTFPDDPAIGPLVQDMLIALGQRAVAFKLYEPLAHANSVSQALLAARATAPEQAREAYARVRERFPNAPEALRALARIRLADGYPQQALKLLDEALSKGPESLEDLELRVRALVSAEQIREASGIVKQFHGNPRHASLESAILAGRLARIAGPTKTQYVSRDLLPPALASAPEHRVIFALLTGDSDVSDAQLSAVADPVTREALTLTRALFTDFEAAVKQASTARGHVLSRLDPETAAVLALELSRRGEKEAAHRVFGSSLSLMAAREPLVAYVSTGTVQPGFPLLPPGLQAAAHLIRARADEQNLLVEQAYARWADALGGMARRALGPKEVEPVVRKKDPYDYLRWRRWSHAPIITREFLEARQKPPPGPPPTPAPTRDGERLPRPWPAP
jgi:tetratricopeptide (TPR) repeat protein